MQFPKYNMAWNQGATETKVFQMLDSSDQPQDLTGYSARMQLRTSFTAETPSLSLDNQTIGGIVVDPLLGKLTITATATQTDLLPARDYVYDIEIQSGAFVRRVVEGVVTVRPQVTK